METLVDVVGLALVAKVTLAIVVQEILVEGFGEIGSLLNAGLLQGDVYLSVRTDSSDVALHLVTRMDVLEDLVLIEETRILVVDDNLEAEVGLLPDEEIHLITMLVVRMVFVEITLNLGRGNDAIALLVDVDMHDVGAKPSTMRFFCSRNGQKMSFISPQPRKAPYSLTHFTSR